MTYKIDHAKTPKSQLPYVTSAMQAKDPSYTRIFEKMGYLTRVMVADNKDDLNALRELYQEVVGKKPFNGWDADKLKAKIAEAS